MMKLRELLKDLAIVLLIISAVLLTDRAWFYSVGQTNDLKSILTGKKEEVPSAYEEYEEYSYVLSILTPLRAVVRNDSGLCTISSRDSTRSLYERTQIVLGEALATAINSERISDNVWKNALSTNMVLYDFDGEIPLRCIASAGSISAGSIPDSDINALAMSAGTDGNVVLYYLDSDGNAFKSSTDAQASYLYSVLSSFVSDGSEFLFERDANIDSLLTTAPITRTVLTKTIPIGDTVSSDTDRIISTVLESFGFNSYTVKPYPEADGTRVYVEELDTLRLSADGHVRFYSPAADSAPSIEKPTNLQRSNLLGKAAKLCEQSLGAYMGDASLYLLKYYRDKDSGRFVLLFGAECGGVPILLENGYIASVEFRGMELAAADVKLVNFRKTASDELLLPAAQAWAAMGKGKLCLRIAANGDTYSSDWYALK